MPYISLDRTAAAVVAAPTLAAPETGGDETLLTLRTELKALLGNRSDILDPRLDTWINEAYEDLATSIDIPELHLSMSFPTVVGQPLYLLPRQVIRTERASLIDTVDFSEGGSPLEKIDLGRYRRLPDQSSLPDKYFFKNQLFVLYGTPDTVKTISLDVYVRPQRLVDDTDSPLIANEYFSILKQNARAKGFDAVQEWEAGAQSENKFISEVRRKTDVQAEERGDMVAAFRPARSYRNLRRNNPTDRGDF